MQRVETDTEKIVAILHDVVEDTPWTFEKLKREGFPPAIIEAIDSVTKRTGEEYEDFVQRSARNAIGRRVKLADLGDNMDVRRLLEISDEDAERLGKYLRAWKSLTSDR